MLRGAGRAEKIAFEMIDQPHSFTINDWSAFPDANELRRGDVTKKLESRVMDLLVYLHQNSGMVVGRDEIIFDVWGKEALSDHSISVAIAALRRALGDDAANPRYIETVRKKGYRLIANTGVETPAIPAMPAMQNKTANLRTGLAALAACAVAFVAAIIVLLPRPSTPLSSEPLIVVQDFTNATNDETLDSLASTLSDLFLAELARDDRAKIQRAVPDSLKGSLRNGLSQEGVTGRVTGRLVSDNGDIHLSIYLEDPATTQIIWSGDQIVDQDKSLGVARALTANLLTRIEPVVSETSLAFGENADTRPAQLIRLAEKLESIRSDATTRTAHSLAQQALSIDPEYGPAHGLLAFLYAESGPAYWGMKGDRYARADESLALARKFGSDEARNLVTEAYLRRARDGRPDMASVLLDRAIDLAPDDPWVLRMSILNNIVVGAFDEALANNVKAVSHSLDPASILAERMFPLYFLQRYDETVALYAATRQQDLLPVYYGPQAAILSGDHVLGFELWIDLLRAHDVKISDETLPLEWIADGDVQAAYDWLQPQLPDALSQKNVPLIRASWHMTAGDSDAAMETILAAAREIFGNLDEKPAPTMLWSVIQYDPIYDPLRNDPRMKEVIALVGIEAIVAEYRNRRKGGPGVAAFSSPG